jgi:hypothetical protein
MTPTSYARVALHDPHTGPDWRWRRASELANGDPHAGKYTDDAITLRAVRYQIDSNDPDVDDIRDAAAVHAADGLRRRALEAYLLTSLPADEVAARTGLSPAAGAAYEALFFAVRGGDPQSRELRAEAVGSGDPLVKAARQGDSPLVAARVRYEAGDPSMNVELAERFERDDLLDELLGSNPAAYVRAVDRLRAIQDRDRLRRVHGRS